MEGTFWALVPALITIIIALITKQVYISLFIGIFTGAMLFAHGNPLTAFENLFEVMAKTLSGDGGSHGAILIFILMLGVLVALIDKAGGTKAMGNWFASNVKSRKGMLAVTAGFGALMFMDDYFNRLATGTVMRPITDKYRISRVKLAYIIGSLSVAVCVLVPISSWASAIESNIASGLTEEALNGDNIYSLYLKSAACNFYPILTIVFIFATIALGMDFFGIRKRELNTMETQDPNCGMEATFKSEEHHAEKSTGKIIDLVLPIAFMIAFSIGFMIYFSATDSSSGSEIALACGSTVAVIATLIMYLIRKNITLKGFTQSLGDGFKSICDVFMILILAWTLADICAELEINTFISSIANAMGDMKVLLPAIMMLIAMGISFATGTSWGTFGIIVPLVNPMFVGQIGSELYLLTVAAVLSGAVFGDQVSPISDATILAAATTKCNHMDYVRCQLPVALMVAVLSFVGFLIGGITKSITIGWIVTAGAFVILMTVSYFVQRSKNMLLPKFDSSMIVDDPEAVIQAALAAKQSEKQ